MRVCRLSPILTGDVDLPKIDGLIYSLNGTVEIGMDAGGAGMGGTPGNLQIAAGTYLFAETADSGLLVHRGSQINAMGTAADPIIFTSRENVIGSSTIDSSGQWDGLTILGRAPVNNCLSGNPNNADQDRADCEQSLPGYSSALFGGNAADDNSGLLEFLQIRFAGGKSGIDDGGLRLAGVGGGTTVRNVQVANSGGDGIQIRGGKVGIFDTLVSEFLDDGIDTDAGYQGFLQNITVYTDRFPAQHGLEAGSEGNIERLPRQLLFGNKLTFVGGTNSTGSAIELGGAGDYFIYNSVFGGFPTCLDIDNFATVRIAEPDLQELGPPMFGSVLLGCGEPYEETDGDILGLNIYFDMFDNVDDDPELTLSDDFVQGLNENAVPYIDLDAISVDLNTALIVLELSILFDDSTQVGSDIPRTIEWGCSDGTGFPQLPDDIVRRTVCFRF